MSKQTPEGAILHSIMDYLAAERILAFRMNTGAVVSEYKGKKRFMRFGTPGMADILAFVHAAPLWLEVKSATGKLSPEQKSFQSMVEGHGHRYAVVRSIDDVQAAQAFSMGVQKG